MRYQERLNRLHNEVVAKLKSITDRPEGWLPHTVFIEDVCDIEGTPIYSKYKLVGFTPDGDCQLQNIVTNQIEDDKYLSEIDTIWLVTVLDRYYELKKERVKMDYQTKHQELRQEIIGKLSAITDRPKGWLPHVVYVQDGDCDSADPEAKLYNQYQLYDFQDTGECQIINLNTCEIETAALCEIETEGLITILNWYGELTGNYIYADKPKELRAFVFPIELGRDISDEELLRLWNDVDSEVESRTPDEFAALLNDEMFDEANSYVRFINI